MAAPPLQPFHTPTECCSLACAHRTESHCLAQCSHRGRWTSLACVVPRAKGRQTCRGGKLTAHFGCIPHILGHAQCQCTVDHLLQCENYSCEAAAKQGSAKQYAEMNSHSTAPSPFMLPSRGHAVLANESFWLSLAISLLRGSTVAFLGPWGYVPRPHLPGPRGTHHNGGYECTHTTWGPRSPHTEGTAVFRLPHKSGHRGWATGDAQCAPLECQPCTCPVERQEPPEMCVAGHS